MKTSQFLAVTIIALGNLPLMARQVDASSSDDDKAKTTYAPASAEFGDEAQSRSWEMSQVTGDLEGKLDSKTAKVGDRVTLRTADKVQTSDGTIIPRGARLVGHITQVQAHDNDRAIAQIAIAFDHAELKNGQSIPVHTLIRTVRPSGSVTGMSALDNNDDTMGASTMGGARMGDARGGGSVYGGGIGAGGGVTGGAGGIGNGNVGAMGRVDPDRTGGTLGGTADGTGIGAGAGTGMGTGAGTGVGSRDDSSVQLAGHGDAPYSGGAHAAASRRAVPHPTGIPGIMLAGSSTASGLLIDADRKDIEFASGTRFEMGVVADH